MDTRTYDWKDVANSQFEKALTMAVLVLLFGVMVSPRIEIQQQKFAIKQLSVVDLPPDKREEIKPPEDIKPVVDIVISDELATTDANDPALDSLLTQFAINLKESKPKTEEKMFEFVPYEDPPEPINPVAPEYPAFAIKTGLQGSVVLEVDVYSDGTLGKIKVKKSLMPGPNGLDEAAINAVKKWKFQPGKSGGKPVDTTVIIPIDFTLTN